MQELIERFLVGRSDRQTIAKYAKGKDRYMGLLTLISAALLGMGVAAPFATVENFYGLQGQFSVVTGSLELLKSGYGVYALIGMGLFILVPVFSIATAFDLWYKYPLQSEKLERMIARANACGKIWFLVMLGTISLIYYVKMYSNETIMHLPVYYLLLSVVSQKLVLSRIFRLFSMIKFED